MSLLERTLLEVPPGGQPEDLDVASNVLGNLLADPRLLDEPEIQQLAGEDFYRATHAELYRWLVHRGPDASPLAVTEARDAMVKTDLQPPGGSWLSWLMGLVDHSFRDWRWSAGRLRTLAVARRTCESSMRLYRLALRPAHTDTVETLASAASSLLGHLGGVSDLQVRTAPDIGATFLDQLEDSLAGRSDPPMSTGIDSLDDTLGGGVHAGDFVVIGARPSCGKTSLARGIAVALALAGTGVLFCSLEVREQQVYRDLISGRSGIPAQVLRAGTLNETQRSLAVEAWEWIQGNLGALRVTDRHKTLDSILSAARSQARLHGVRVVVVDYLQLVAVPGAPRGSTRREQVGEVSRALKQLALDHHVCVLALAQLNREVDKQADREPRMADLKESGDIEQDADVIALLHRPDKQRERASGAPRSAPRVGQAELIVAKQRSGPTGRVCLEFHGPSMVFSEPVLPPDESDRRFP